MLYVLYPAVSGFSVLLFSGIFIWLLFTKFIDLVFFFFLGCALLNFLLYLLSCLEKEGESDGLKFATVFFSVISLGIAIFIGVKGDVFVKLGEYHTKAQKQNLIAGKSKF